MVMVTDSTELDPQIVGTDGSGEATSDAKPDDTNRKRLVSRIARTIRADKKYHEDAYEQMRQDMQFARRGADASWISADKYVANITGRHTRQKTNALYAKNPKVVARNRERLDFQLWDGSPTSLQMAIQVIQMSTQAAAALPGQPLPPAQEAQLAEAQALIADFQQGYNREQMTKKFGKTLEILFSQSMQTQKPLDFKMAMKRVVRRAITTGVGYCEVNFQRETGPSAITASGLTDARTRLDHLRRLYEMATDEDDTKSDMEAEIAELELSITSLMSEPEIVLREGLVLDFPDSTKVIPDKLCKSLVGFVGARHITIEYPYTVDEVKETFGVDLGNKYTPYRTEDAFEDDETSDLEGSEEDEQTTDRKGHGMVCVWKHYDKVSGLVYYLVDGYDDFLREPAAPDVFVSDFWPVYSLTFNDVESEKQLFPPSDVALMRDQQKELNRSRQGMRDHRYAAMPRWLYRKGALDEQNDIPLLQSAKPFQAIGLNIGDEKLADVLQAAPVFGVDMNLYDTSQFFNDATLVVGASASRLGGTSKSTATEAAIAEGSATEDDASGIDDLDAFLTMIARAAGQILVREMSPEQVAKMAGPGAVWPGLTEGFEVSREDLMDELWLEVEAGSTGKPNQAVEANNWKILAPLAMQIPGVSPMWLARETIRRMDDRADLNEAIAEGIPAMVAMNRNAQPMGEDPQNDPNAQGPEGGDTTSTPSGPSGTDAAFGSNQM